MRRERVEIEGQRDLRKKLFRENVNVGRGSADLADEENFVLSKSLWYFLAEELIF